MTDDQNSRRAYDHLLFRRLHVRSPSRHMPVLDLRHSFILPDFPATTKWLTEEERAYAVARLAEDNNIDSRDDEAVGHLRSIVLAVKDWRTWLFCFGQSTCTAAGTITYFVPTLMEALGYHGTRLQYVRYERSSGCHSADLDLDDGTNL